MLIQLFVLPISSCALNSPTASQERCKEFAMADTAAMLILLTNGKSQNLTLTSAKITGSSSASKLDLPPTLTQGTFGGYGTPASTTPYQATWSYSPDGGQRS
jgi:hypothetical protein